MLYESDPRDEQARFYGYNVLEKAPRQFGARVNEALKYIRQKGIQMMLFKESDSKVAFERGMNDVFVELDSDYRESFHRVGEETYHVLLVGFGARETVRSISLALGIAREESETISAETAHTRKYPIRYKPTAK